MDVDCLQVAGEIIFYEKRKIRQVNIDPGSKYYDISGIFMYVL